MFLFDYNAFRSIETLCCMVSNNFSEIAKYNDQQIKNQRLSIL